MTAETKAERYALVDAKGDVVNIIMWDGETAYEPPDGCTVRLAADGDVIAPDPATADLARVAEERARTIAAAREALDNGKTDDAVAQLLDLLGT